MPKGVLVAIASTLAVAVARTLGGDLGSHRCYTQGRGWPSSCSAYQ